MSERGVFAVDRGIWADPDFADEAFSEREAFIWLVGQAAWKATRARVGSAVIELERGQCAFSTRFMAAAWKWSEARVRRFLSRLTDRKTVCTKTDARATQITICNYDRFQRVSLPSDAPATHQRRKEEDREYTEDREDSSGPKGPSARTSKGCRLASDFRLSVADRQFASDDGWTDREIDQAEAEFVDHWSNVPGEKGLKLDWSKTWRNRVRRFGRPAAMTRAGPSRFEGRDSAATILLKRDAEARRVQSSDEPDFFDVPTGRADAGGRPPRDAAPQRDRMGGPGPILDLVPVRSFGR